ncbi:uncharacterized protein [Montipora capricornis]|uniref:uncharacterized protein isoform X2 n=1 Tax=Montipora capricornis TaxID=246305 RepID=UPI0035F1E34B
MYYHDFRVMFKIICLWLVVIVSHMVAGSDEYPRDCLFVSRQSGQDSSFCGSTKQPCKTLSLALRKVQDGGKVCLDGRNTESDPYGCALRNVTSLADVLDKSVTIQGWMSKAHISCPYKYGLVFGSTTEYGIFRLKLSNLVFHNNGVRLLKVGCSHILISNCRFINCDTAFEIWKNKSLYYRKSSLVISDTQFLYNNISVFVQLINEHFFINISRCLFKGKVGRFNLTSEDRKVFGSVYVRSASPWNRVRVHGSISDSTFRELGHKHNGFAVSFRILELFSIGKLSLLNVTFLNNENSLFVYGGFDVQLTKVTINCSYGRAITASAPPKLNPGIVGIKVTLDQCVLGNNRNGIFMATNVCLNCNANCSAGEQYLFVKNTSIVGGNETKGSGYSVNFRVKNYDTRRPNFIRALVFLENVTFKGLHNSALYVAIQKNVRGKIVVKNCKFINNSQYVYQLDERATVDIQFSDEDPPDSCSRLPNHKSIFLWNNSHQMPVTFEDSSFEGNIGIWGALNLFNGNVTLKNCTFKDNLGFTAGGHVYMKTGYGSLSIEDSTFLHDPLNRFSKSKNGQISSTGCFVHSESAGPVRISNSSFTANMNRKFNPIFTITRTSSLKVDAVTTFRCPSGKHMKMNEAVKTEGFQFTQGNNLTICLMELSYITMFCDKCPNDFYSLKRGMTAGLNVVKKTMCRKCPHGASCESGNIEARQNFWGLPISKNPPRIQFFPCPLDYCITPSHSIRHPYNACYGKRSGILCGQCRKGYSEALHSTSCKKNEKCHNHWFWVATIIYVAAFAAYFVFKPPILSVLYKQTLWFKELPRHDDTQTLTSHEAEKETHDPGYLKIIFYFYQVAELLMLKSPEETLHMLPFIPSVIAIFNFQVKTLYGSIDCPFPGLNVVTKELFLCLKFFAILLAIGFIYIIHRAASKSKKISPPKLTLYLAVALETLLLGYETLADTTLKLMHCVPMGLSWRLFIDGNIQCWQWWQYILIGFVMVFVIPLILVLFWGSLMLAKDKVSAKKFLIACAFPLPCLVLWLVRHCRKSENEDVPFIWNLEDAEEIKKVLHEAFREPSGNDSGTLYWESILTGRRFILLTIHTFVTDSVTRFITLDMACIMILVHHLSLRPFRDLKANIFETISLLSLVAICTFSLAEATYLSEGIEPAGPNQNLFHVLQWIELGALSLVPILVCIFVALAVLSQISRLVYHCVKLLSNFTSSRSYLNGNETLGGLSMSGQLLINCDYEEDDLQLLD